MKYSLTTDTWGDEEISAIQAVVKSRNYTMGAKVAEFESDFARHFGSKFAVMVNSGSSANLLAVAALRYSRDYSLMPGDEVLVPAVSWSTTYFPLYQYGLTLRFVDIDLSTLMPTAAAFEAAITPRTKAIFAVNLLGSSNDFDRLTQVCRARDLILLEDNCESMGARFAGKYTGTFGLCGTFSTFFSHHICTMEGGVVVTDSEELRDILKSLRAHGWLRDLSSDNRLQRKSSDEWENLFRFTLPGYNLRPLEMSGAIGIEQLKKLSKIIEARRANAQTFIELFGNVPYLTIQKPVGESSWFGFSMILAGPLFGKRDLVVRRLMENGIESRPIVAGNFCRNAAVRFLDFTTHGELQNADRVDEQGLFVGNNSRNLSKELYFLKHVLESSD